jgi:hypothetical protein
MTTNTVFFNLRRSFQRNVLSWLPILLLAMLGTAQAKNPEHSFWYQNLSEPDAVTAPGYTDSLAELAVSGNTVHAIWFATDYYTYRLYYQRSLNNGETWEEKQLLIEGVYLGRGETHRRLAVSGDYVHVALTTARDGASAAMTYIRSTDGGATFEAPRQLRQFAEMYGQYISATGNHVTITYQEYHRPTSAAWYQDITVLLSEDNGENFVETNVFETDAHSDYRLFDMQRSGDHIAILYGHYEVGSKRLFIATSNDGGATFDIYEPPNANVHDHVQNIWHYVPKIAISGQTISVLWTGYDVDGTQATLFTRSSDGGLTWMPVGNLATGLLPEGYRALAGEETIAAAGDYVYALLPTERYDDRNLYLRVSTDGGAQFGPLQQLTNDTGSYTSAGWPMLHLDPRDPTGASFFAYWPAAYRYSNDGGRTLSMPVVLNPTFSTSDGGYRPAIAVGEDGRLHSTNEVKFSSNELCGGYCDIDIFYRRVDLTAPPAGDQGQALHLVSDVVDQRFDNFQAPSSEWLDITEVLTLELWVKPLAGGKTTSDYWFPSKPIVYKMNSAHALGTSNGDFAYGLLTRRCTGCADDAWQATARITTSDGYFELVPGDSTVGILPNEQWAHLALTYDANGDADNFNLYMNGELIASTTATGTLSSATAPLFAGIYGHWEIDDLRIWNRVRTESELDAAMQTPLTGQETELNAYYSFDGTTRDLTGHGNDGLLMYREEFVEGIVGMAPPSSGICTIAEQTLTEAITSGAHDYRSETAITVAGSVQVSAEAALMLTAPRITFKPGFTMAAGGQLTATAAAVSCGNEANEIIFRPGPGRNDGTDQGTLDGGKDAWFYQERPDENGGADATLFSMPISTCNSTEAWSLIQFDLASLPVAQDVQQVLLGYSSPGQETCLSNCTVEYGLYSIDTDWDEMSVTSNHRPTYDQSSRTDSILLNAPMGAYRHEFDITNLYQEWQNGERMNHGLVIIGETSGCNNFAAMVVAFSSDHEVPEERPYLRILKTAPDL